MSVSGNRPRVRWRHFRNAGGYDFPCDPDTPSDQQSLFWIPSLQPQAVSLTIVPQAIDADAVTPIALTQLDGLDLRQSDDGWHGVWQADGVTHQFWLVHAPSEVATFYAVILPLDALLELRVHAARRFWRALNGRAPGPDFRAMPAQLRRFHILSLRALDARQRGESYRTIAKVLLGFRGTKEDWENDPRKNQARRLVAHGLSMMKGGYRLLLHYPIKLRRR
ncbi:MULTISPECIES: DUF2285 domain-containing protein [Phyllobacteriaceae]|uniref:DUF2285 domain-containing protein n=1 Tax=Phyllobacteriaceae TaxID=69277 RepID=UPI003CCA0741